MRLESADQNLIRGAIDVRASVLVFAFQSHVDRKIVAVLFLSLHNRKREKKRRKAKTLSLADCQVKNVLNISISEYKKLTEPNARI